MTKSLDDTRYNRILELSRQGEILFDQSMYESAIQRYLEALEQVPRPKEDWDASTWLLAAIGDSYFMLKDYDRSLKRFLDAYNCPSGLENPFINLRIGQCYFELKLLKEAEDFLLRAYLIEGVNIFQSEKKKYLNYLKDKFDI